MISQHNVEHSFDNSKNDNELISNIELVVIGIYNEGDCVSGKNSNPHSQVSLVINAKCGHFK